MQAQLLSLNLTMNYLDALVYKHHVSNGTLYRMRKNEALSTVTINDLCKILKCRVEDILLYVMPTEQIKNPRR